MPKRTTKTQKKKITDHAPTIAITRGSTEEYVPQGEVLEIFKDLELPPLEGELAHLTISKGMTETDGNGNYSKLNVSLTLPATYSPEGISDSHLVGTNIVEEILFKEKQAIENAS